MMFKNIFLIVLGCTTLVVINIFLVYAKGYSLSDSNSTELFENLSSKFVNLLEKVIIILKSAVLNISRIAYSLVGMVGVLLYFSRLNKRLGLDLIKGALILALISEIIFPFLL
ncbi:MAG: hypothetical protein ACPLW4_00435 [Nitrososphaeria archaeon]